MKKTVGTTPMIVMTKQGPGRPLIQNLGPGKLYLDSDPAVSVASGFEVGVGGVYESSTASASGNALWMVADTVGTDVRVVTL